MTEIDIASDQEHAERGGTAATDLQLESEQRAMQALYDYQNAARTARETDRQRVPLPSLQIYSDLPREWPMARLAISNKQINRLVRTFLWRRVTEQALHGSSFVDIPDEINQAYIGDLLRISEAFAAPLSNLFAFVKSGHPACPFITHKQLALYASPRFWQYGLLAFIARCCSFDNQHRHQGTGTAQAVEGKSQTTKEKDVDALTFMRTVIMSFVGGMEHGEQTLPTNDLFVYLPVQILPDLVVAMERQGFTPAEVEGGYGYRPKEGRFGIGYTRLATALGNFEQGNIEAESAVVAQWLTSGLRVAMSRTGWNLLSPRFMLTKVPGVVLSDYYCHGYPFTPKMADRPYNQYGPYLYSEDRWDQLCTWLTGNSNFRLQLAGHKQALRDHMGYSQEASDPSNKARRTVPPPGAGSSSSAAGFSWHNRPPPSPSPYGWSYGWWQ